jgi:large subunit ribosomal protein L21
LISSHGNLGCHRNCICHFSSSRSDDNEDSGIEDERERSEDEEDLEDGSEDEDTSSYMAEEKEAAAEAIGYKVVGPLQKEEMDAVFHRYERIFAVVQIGSHQFKVSNGDCIFAEKLKFCDVNDKLTLNKVLLLGTETRTIIGRPIVPDATVHAVVEEHALDAKVIIFKKKRRKNYRRTNGHRQELTKLRITDIQGISKPEHKVEKPYKKPEKVATKKKRGKFAPTKKPEKVAAPA